METNKTLELWTTIKLAVEALEKDMEKNAVKHNCSAGVRVREGVRGIAKLCREVSRETLAADKATRTARAETPAAQERASARKAKAAASPTA